MWIKSFRHKESQKQNKSPGSGERTSDTRQKARTPGPDVELELQIENKPIQDGGDEDAPLWLNWLSGTN